jgi:hypothetical protein
VRGWRGAQSDEIVDGRPTSLIRTRGKAELRMVAYETGEEHEGANVKLGESIFRSATQGMGQRSRQRHSGWGEGRESGRV